MSTAKDGGSAFPLPDGHGVYSGGMSLRDYFAAKAMQGMLSNTDENDEALHRKGFLFQSLAENAYEMADAMLKAREA